MNDIPLDILWKNSQTESSQNLFLGDSPADPQTEDPVDFFELSWVGVTASESQIVEFTIFCPAGHSTFTVVMRPNSAAPVVGISLDKNIAAVIEAMPPAYHDSPTSSVDGYADDNMSDASSDELDLSDEIEALHLLQTQAKKLDAYITMKQKSIAYRLKHEQDQLCLKHLIKECDGVMCAAKAIWQRVCDKVGIKTDPSFRLAGLPHQRQQSMIQLHSNEKSAHNCANGTTHQAEEMNVPLMLTKGGDDQMRTFSGFDLVQPSNPLVKALSIIAAVLGITALLLFIKRKCSSMRTRVERKADREERKNARAYRRAARRALMRKRWACFINTMNCFKAELEPRTGDYEEKRALILQEAFLEQDLDQAEKGEVMEAEIRELRHAHEIVASLVQVGEHRFEMLTPVYQPPPPPPPPLSSTATDVRSRANSTYTLPSYTSESLPDYTSRPGDQSSANSVVNGYTPSTSESQGRQSPVSPMSETSQHSRFTPTSSVLEMSPRPSEETLRTRPSGETTYRGY